MMRQRLSLRAQAVAWLAQREHSERELRRKLLRRLQAEPTPSHAGSGSTGAEPPAAPSSHADEVNEVIAWLRERGYLDETRFVDSRVHVRAGRFGLARIQQELLQHGLAVPQETAQALRATELERATVLWQRRFGQPGADLKETARQARFLTTRGFSSEVVRKVLRAAEAAGRNKHDAA